MVSSNPGIAADKVFREEATLIRSTVYFSQILQYTENSKKLNQRVLEEVDKIIQAEKDANFVSNYSWIYRIEIMFFKTRMYASNLLIIYLFSYVQDQNANTIGDSSVSGSICAVCNVDYHNSKSVNIQVTNNSNCPLAFYKLYRCVLCV